MTLFSPSSLLRLRVAEAREEAGRVRLLPRRAAARGEVVAVHGPLVGERRVKVAHVLLALQLGHGGVHVAEELAPSSVMHGLVSR